MLNLRTLSPGQAFRVIRLHGEGATRQRMMDMGLTRGATGLVRKIAPLGDPIEIRVRSYELSIRKSDAELVEIESIAPEEVE